LASDTTNQAMRDKLLSDLGFVVIPFFVTSSEEEELLSYWRPGRPIYERGTYEFGSNRCFFHYGPILKLKTEKTEKSTLGIVPGRCGVMPPVVVQMDLQTRVQEQVLRSGVSTDRGAGEMNQLYVNHYSTECCNGIAFHIDNPKTMKGIIAGLSLGNACELHLTCLDKEVRRTPPIVIDLPPRSLYFMTGISRYHLLHGIPALTADRLSLTFRSVNMACADQSLWKRDWSEISTREASNCHWPLLPPESSAVA
jgi:alkylated DNA repair dioxygenase AlkB